MKNSLDQIIDAPTKIITLHTKQKTVASDLKLLKQHFVEINSILSKQLCKYSVQQSKASYYKKLSFTYRLEQQSAKLLILLLVQKINNIVILKNFYTQTLKVPSFLCFDKIILRECFEMI